MQSVISIFYIVGGFKNRRIDIGKGRTECFKHVSDACLFNRHLLYHWSNTPYKSLPRFMCSRCSELVQVRVDDDIINQ